MVFCWNFLNSVPTSSPVQSTTEINNPSLTHHSQKCWKCAILQEICHRLWQIDCFLQMLIRWCAQEGAPSKDLGIFWQFQWGAGSGGVLDTARYGVDIWMLVSKETYPKIAELFKLCCFFWYVVLPRWCCSNPARSAPKKRGGSPVPRAEILGPPWPLILSSWSTLGGFSSLFCYGIVWVNQLVKCPCWRHKSNENSFDRGCAKLDTISKQKTGGTVAAAQVEKDIFKTKKTKTLPVREEIGKPAGKDQNGWDLEKFVCLYMSW